ncbi:MAG: hypothetical protein DHS20C18_46240 [Saprospiraceae bacterium]|nr:MAG: hypothetical protein DHS20C18_46240 [Saprospiraceae bacterium]
MFTSCFTPKSVVRINPEGENVRWNYGQAFARQKLGELEVQAAFSSYDKNFVMFDVEVINYSQEEVLVSPEYLFLEADGRQYKAIDPERKLLSMEIDESRRDAGRKNLAVAIGAAAVVGAVAAIASDSDDNEGVDNDNNEELAVTSLYVGATIAPAVAQRPLPPPGPENSWFWSDFALRKTTLGPNEKVSGRVMFPRNDGLARIILVAPIKEEIFRLNFQQIIYKP